MNAVCSRNPDLRVWLAVCLVFAVCMDVAGVAALENVPAEKDKFGEIFVHPRDRHYLPDKAPSRALRQTEEKVLDPVRGTLYRYEYKKGKTTIYRDVWEDPDLGQRGSFGLRFKF